MGIYQEKYTLEYFTGVDKDGVPVGYGAEQERDSEGLWQLRSHDRKILDVVDFTGKQVLDIGFGRGEAICHAYINGATNCVGVDFSEAAVSLAKELIGKRHLPEAQLYHSDANTFVQEFAKKNYDIETKKFDIVLMLNFVEHMPRTELSGMLNCLKNIITPNAIVVVNTPEYKYDNDVILNGFDERNLIEYTDTSDIVPETQGMHCNKYTVISLQNFMSECDFLNISEAHFYVMKSLFEEKTSTIDLLQYSERWRLSKERKVPLKSEYVDDIIEFPYKTIEIPTYLKFGQGNMSGLTLLLTKTFKEIIFPGGNYDPELFATLKPEEIENKVIFEVGAFMGVNSLLFAKSSSPNGKVFAFEPNPWNRNRLFLNLSHNQDLAKRIEVYDYALGEINDVSSMTMSSEIDKGYSSTSRISDSHAKINRKDLPPGFFETDVKIRTLDWFVETTGVVPDVIKIDVEGAEYFMLRGGLTTLQNHRPILFIELHSEFCALQCSLLLQGLDYQILVLKEEMDNRLMVKAIPVIQSVKSDASNQNKYLDVISNQYEIVKQLQWFYNKELSEHTTMQAKRHDLQAAYQVLLGEHQTLQAEHETILAERETLLAEHETLLAERETLLAERETTNADYQILRSTYQALQTEHQTLSEESQALQSSYQDLQTEHQTQFDESQALQSSYQALQTEHQTLLDETRISQASYQALQTEYQISQGKSQALEADHQALLSVYQTFQMKSQVIQAEYQSLQKEYQTLQRENQTLQTEYQALLKSKGVRFSNQLKRILGKAGINKFKQ